jgi:hypothetical protein
MSKLVKQRSKKAGLAPARINHNVPIGHSQGIFPTSNNYVYIIFQVHFLNLKNSINRL